MKNASKSRMWTPRLHVIVACATAMSFGWPGLSENELAFEAIESGDAIELALGEGEDDSLDLINVQPGFALLLAEEDLQKQMAQLNAFFELEDWAKAFRLLTELDPSKLQVMVPMGDDGRYMLVKQGIQQRLLELPVAGRRAFQLYFDGQAAEQFEQIKNHPLPGSDEQLMLTQNLVDRLLASSVGGEAAVLLGDMYFGRGLFDQAERSWRLALDEGSATGQAVLTLQAKRALAMQRAGRSAEAFALFDQLRARYDDATINAGGEAVNALALLEQALGQAEPGDLAQAGPAPLGEVLPKPDAMPLWHLSFLDEVARSKTQSRNRNSWYSPPTDLLKFVPPVVSDDQRVYFNWLGVVFALDRQTGKINWLSGSIEETAELVPARLQTNHGDPRNYRIAISNDTLLVTAPQNADRQSGFVLKAHDRDNGQPRWSSDERPDWSLGEVSDNPKHPSTVLGQVLVHEANAYAIVARAGQTNMHLRRFSPDTGEVDWTIPLGGAEAITFQYTQVKRMPQPTLMMGPSLLYVMTNNGALLAVDLTAGEVRWALKMDPPFGINEPTTRGFVRGNMLGDKIASLSNTNGSGRLLLQDGTLYAKEHNGKTLYAIDPATGKVHWSADKLMPDAKLVGVDDTRFYVMDRALQSYAIEGNHDRLNMNGQQTGSPDHAGAVLLEDRILLYANGKLRQLETTQLDPAGKYEKSEYLGQRGGHLYVFNDLLIAIDTTQITAFQIPNKIK